MKANTRYDHFWNLSFIPLNWAFCKNWDFTWQRWYAVCADRSMQPVIDGNCHFLLLFLSGNHYAPTCQFSPPQYSGFTFIWIKWHTAHESFFLNMCKMEKIPLLNHDSMIPAHKESSSVCCLITVSSSLHSALAGIKWSPVATLRLNDHLKNRTNPTERCCSRIVEGKTAWNGSLVESRNLWKYFFSDGSTK